MMHYNDFLERVINEGIEACNVDYVNDKNRREGSVAGFEACRGKQPFELIDIHNEANDYAYKAARDDKENYWYFRCYQLEVEWVMNVVSATLINQGLQPLMAHLPTARGMMKAADILGVSQI